MSLMLVVWVNVDFGNVHMPMVGRASLDVNSGLVQCSHCWCLNISFKVVKFAVCFVLLWDVNSGIVPMSMVLLRGWTSRPGLFKSHLLLFN